MSNLGKIEGSEHKVCEEISDEKMHRSQQVIDKAHAAVKEALFDISDLNDRCPFGDRSTKYLSMMSHTPDIAATKHANKAITEALMGFLGSLDAVPPPRRESISVEDFFLLAKQGSSVHNHMPSSFEEIFPISLDRNAGEILRVLQKCSDPLIQSLCKKHEEMYASEHSHVQAARKVMTSLKKAFEHIRVDANAQITAQKIADAINSSTFLPKNLEQSFVMPVSLETQKALVSYQSIQERFEDSKQIGDINDFIYSRPDIVEAIIDVQLRFCSMLQSKIQESPQMLNYSIAFAEIAVFGKDIPNVIPSTRFLKIILHNLGKYFIEVPSQSSAQILKHAVDRSLEDDLYFQNIFIFRTEADTIQVHGIVPKVCPARNFVKPMFRYFL